MLLVSVVSCFKSDTCKKHNHAGRECSDTVQPGHRLCTEIPFINRGTDWRTYPHFDPRVIPGDIPLLWTAYREFVGRSGNYSANLWKFVNNRVDGCVWFRRSRVKNHVRRGVQPPLWFSGLVDKDFHLVGDLTKASTPAISANATIGSVRLFQPGLGHRVRILHPGLRL